MVFDFTNEEFGFLYKAKDDYFEDDETVAGMETEEAGSVHP